MAMLTTMSTDKETIKRLNSLYEFKAMENIKYVKTITLRRYRRNDRKKSIDTCNRVLPRQGGTNKNTVEGESRGTAILCFAKMRRGSQKG